MEKSMGGKMKFFIDTAKLEEIENAVKLGIVDGVTTNPTLLSKAAPENVEEYIKKICEIVEGPVSLEVLSTDCNGMIKEAKKLAAIAKNVVVKIPITKEGIKATKHLSKEGIKVNATLCFSINQALLAAKAGAGFVSPFVGRLDDIGQDGMQLVMDIKKVYDNYNFKTEIIVASIRHPIHVTDAALIGADIATIPFDVIEKMFMHPKTDEGIKKFLEDAEKVPEYKELLK